MMKIKLPTKIPSMNDARWIQCSVLFLYAITSRELFNFERNHLTTFTCLLVSIAADFFWGALLYKNILFPLSAVVIALSFGNLIDARSPAPYIIGAIIANSSKALVTYNGRHIFNPSNFAIVSLLQLFPDQVTGMPSLFSGFFLPSIVFICLGLFTSWRAKQLTIAFSWIGGFICFAFVRAFITGTGVVYALVPALSPVFLLYTFHMITDPATTPKSMRYRILFGISVALIDAVFRVSQIPYGGFYALFMVSACMPFVRDIEAKEDRNVGFAY